MLGCQIIKRNLEGRIPFSKAPILKIIHPHPLYGILQNGNEATNISRFQGQTSISSAEYFNRDEPTYGILSLPIIKVET